jgi:ribonuclease J
VAFSLSFEISANPVDHSIFGAVACILRGETTIAYTSDSRLHGKKIEININKESNSLLGPP